MERFVLLRGVSYAIIFTALGLFTATAQAQQTYSADQYYNAGKQSYQTQQYSQAITYLNAAIQLNPSYGDAYQLEGNCYYATGDKNSALLCYNKAAVLEPNNVQLAQMIASLQGTQPNVQLQVNFGSTSSTTSTTTSSTSSNIPPGMMTAPPATTAPSVMDSDDSQDSKYYDTAKTRLVRIHGDQMKAYLSDVTSAHTLQHVYLIDQVTNVSFDTNGDGVAWRIYLTRQDGSLYTYDETGRLMVKTPPRP